MFSWMQNHFKSAVIRRNPVVQPRPSVIDVTFQITERRRRHPDNEDPDEVIETERISLIRNRNTYLEAYLNFHSKLGVSPFRLLKTDEIASSWPQKVIT